MICPGKIAGCSLRTLYATFKQTEQYFVGDQIYIDGCAYGLIVSSVEIVEGSIFATYVLTPETIGWSFYNTTFIEYCD